MQSKSPLEGIHEAPCGVSRRGPSSSSTKLLGSTSDPYLTPTWGMITGGGYHFQVRSPQASRSSFKGLPDLETVQEKRKLLAACLSCLIQGL